MKKTGKHTLDSNRPHEQNKLAPNLCLPSYRKDTAMKMPVHILTWFITATQKTGHIDIMYYSGQPLQFLLCQLLSQRALSTKSEILIVQDLIIVLVLILLDVTATTHISHQDNFPNSAHRTHPLQHNQHPPSSPPSSKTNMVNFK